MIKRVRPSALWTLLWFVLLMGAGRTASAQTLPAQKDLPALFDQYGVVMLVIDADTGAIRNANQAALRFYGYSRGQLLTMHIADINTMSSDEITREMVAAKSEQRNYFLFSHRLKNGEIRSVEVYSYPVEIDGRQMLLSTINDVTAREQLAVNQSHLTVLRFVLVAVLFGALLLAVRSRRKLRQANLKTEKQNQLLKTFIDAQGDLVYLKDDQLRYVFVNQAFAQFFNRPVEEFLGKDDFAFSEDAFATVRQKTDIEVLNHPALLHEDAPWDNRIYAVTKFPVQMEVGKLGVGAYVRDITRERQEERHSLMAARRMAILAEMMSRTFATKQERLDYVLGETLQLTDSRYGFIYLYDERARLFTLNTWSRGVMDDCRVIDPQTVYPLDKTGIWGEVVRQRKPLILNNFAAENPLKKGYPNGHVTLTRFLSVPVISGGEIVAVVGVANKSTDYDENDSYELTLLMSAVWNDVKRHEFQTRLAYERSRYLQTLISIGDAVLVIAADGRVEILNAVAETLTGWSARDAVGQQYQAVFAIGHENGRDSVRDPIADAFATGLAQTLCNHTVLTAKSGQRYFIEDSAAPIRNEAGKTEGVVLVFRDVTDKRNQMQQIEYLSFHDALTGLYNRRFFNEEVMRLDTPRNLPLCIILGDLNGLKLTNDIFGHRYGDQLLQRVAGVLKSCCRADDIVARWGGDEFVMILPHTAEADARAVMARIELDVTREKVGALKGSISMGLSCKEKPETEIAYLLSTAEESMYTAKSLKRATFHHEALEEIISALHQNSPGELAHSQAVSALSQQLGHALGLPQEDITRLRDVGYYHDIGKVILDARLLGDGPFTELEWSEIRQHPSVGYRILNNFDQIVNLAEATLTHEERWNGLGYPKGLRGEEIPLFARIIAIAEGYDRLLRRAGGDQAAALQALRLGAGVDFDPTLVAAFVDMLGGKIRSM